MMYICQTTNIFTDINLINSNDGCVYMLIKYGLQGWKGRKGRKAINFFNDALGFICISMYSVWIVWRWMYIIYLWWYFTLMNPYDWHKIHKIESKKYILDYNIISFYLLMLFLKMCLMLWEEYFYSNMPYVSSSHTHLWHYIKPICSFSFSDVSVLSEKFWSIYAIYIFAIFTRIYGDFDVMPRIDLLRRRV